MGMELFERWYAHYPNKKSRGAAEKAWEKIGPDEKLTQEMITSLQIQMRWRAEALKSGEFVPPWKMPSTWLNQQCWLDEVGSFQELRAPKEPQHCTGKGRHCETYAFIHVGNDWLCHWCWTEKHSDLSALRESYRAHGIARKPDEDSQTYRQRLVGICRSLAKRIGQGKVA